jgi:ARC6-like, IMS domain/DnaJ domain
LGRVYFDFLLLRGMGIVRIPLDYYRILGLPIQATAEQLQQAHRDRTLQLPRREFSEAAIAARRELMDEAFALLSDPTQRQAYDASFLARSYDLPDDEAHLENGAHSDPDPYTSSIEIQEHQWVGALLILLEMGEYELVIKLGYPYLGGSHAAGNPEIIAADITLTVALACLELGREQWQQGQYENAAESLTTGKDILLQAGLFANIRGEMYSDLSKLRPYRILELVALPEDHKAEREKGLILLTDMLEERGGMDGAGDDQSGLSMDDFLRFIQQLRSYLTSAEQHALFEKESRRPSAVATFLAVYALLARGFAQRQPGLVRRAKQMLTRLGSRQDVHLEQAVCALLLGQTEEASLALDLSQEIESIAFIREHSQGSPDLLPGLCLYSERWLQNEVFPHFRDLAKKQASLKEYFADEDVQAYLEELPGEPQFPITPSPISPGISSSSGSYRPAPRSEAATIAEPRLQATGREYAYTSNGASNTAVVEPPLVIEDGAIDPPSRNGSASRSYDNSDFGSNGRGDDEGVARRTPPVVPADRTRRANLNSPRLDRLLFLAALSMVGVVLVAFIANWFLHGRSSQPAGAVSSASPVVVDPVKKLQPVLTSKLPASPAASTTATAGALTTESALAVLKNWLTVKSAAMGETRAVDQLPNVLSGAALSQWQNWAEQEKAGNSYLKYEHSDVAVNAVELSPDNPDQAIVEATVVEKKDSYVNGKLDPVTSGSAANLQIRYTFVRQNGQWLIQSIEPI